MKVQNRVKAQKKVRVGQADLQGSGRLLGDVAAAARLAEGPEGVRRVLRAVFTEGAVPIRDLARQVELPVPVVAAVRGELERRGVLERQGGMALTQAGVEAVQRVLGFSCRRRFPRPLYPSLPADLSGLLDRMGEICEGRPGVDVTLDQSHATPETALRRALYLYEYDALEGRDVLILGDDDLSSLAVGLLSEFLGLQVRNLVVLECDGRLVDYLRGTAGRAGYPLEARRHDLRQDLPDELVGRFDVFLTDPPYTLEGLDLFVSRGVTGLRSGAGKQGYVCFGHRSPQETAEAVGALTQMGLAPVEIVPDFNRYVGAQVLAGISQMIRTISTSDVRPRIQGPYRGALYTADRKRSRKRHGR